MNLARPESTTVIPVSLRPRKKIITAADWECTELYEDNSDDDDHYSEDSCDSDELDVSDIVEIVCVECAAKPIKESILSKKRNLLSDEKGATLFRAAQNLRMLHKARQSIKDRVYDGHAL